MQQNVLFKEIYQQEFTLLFEADRLCELQMFSVNANQVYCNKYMCLCEQMVIQTNQYTL